MLDIFITSRVRRKIVVVFAKYPDFKTHVRALSKLIKEDPGNIQRELQRLERGGFLIMTVKGNTKIYQMNKQFPLLKELQSMVIKSQQMSKSKSNRTDKTIGWVGYLMSCCGCGSLMQGFWARRMRNVQTQDCCRIWHGQ